MVDQSYIAFSLGDLQKLNQMFSETEISFKYRKEPYNLGRSHGANVGANNSNLDTLWFLSPDAIVLPSTLYEGVRSLNYNFGIVESR